MPGIPVRRQHGPRSHEVYETVTGGQCVTGRATDNLVGVAGAATKRFLGVATADAVPTSAFQAAPVNGVLDAAPKPNRVGLASRGDEVPVTYAAAAENGQRLKTASGGRVTPVADGDDPQLHVGKCIQRVTTANTVAYMEVL